MSATRTMLASATAAREPRARQLRRLLVDPNVAIFILLVLLLVLATLHTPSFAEPGQFIRFLARTAPVVIVAVGQYFVIVGGELDLSAGALVTAQVVVSGNLIGRDASRVLPVLALMLVLGLVVGVVNGLITTVLKVPSLITTLGTMLVLSGLVLYWTGGSAGQNPVDSFRQIGRGGITGVPVVGVLPWSVLILIAVLVLAAVLVRRPFGKGLVSIGGNPEAARLSGIRVTRGKVVAFVLSALSATVAGVLLVGFAGVQPTVGAGYEFLAVTAVVLGGVALSGGRGWVLSAAAGALTLQVLFVVLNYYGVPATYRDTVQGLIVIAAVAAAQVDWAARARRRS